MRLERVVFLIDLRHIVLTSRYRRPTLTSTDKLFQHAQNEDLADPATKEALRYRTALYRGFLSLAERPLCTATAVEICRTTKGVEMDQTIRVRHHIQLDAPRRPHYATPYHNCGKA